MEHRNCSGKFYKNILTRAEKSSKIITYVNVPEEGRKYRRGNYSMDQIRGKYGSQTFAADGSETNEYTRIGATA